MQIPWTTITTISIPSIIIVISSSSQLIPFYVILKIRLFLIVTWPFWAASFSHLSGSKFAAFAQRPEKLTADSVRKPTMQTTPVHNQEL